MSKASAVAAPLALLAFLSSLRNESAISEAAAQSAQTDIRVWYHSTAGCPEGASFIELLRRFGRVASLASVGDRVDFVVTLAHTDGQSSGRLERQSSERRVAIRDFSAESCAEVAEVLALSLDLALYPGAEAEPGTAPAPGETREWEQRLGAQGSLETGLARAVLPGAALFIEVSPAPLSWSARLSLRGAYAVRDTAEALDVALLASRFEGCWAWMVSSVALGPCAGVDVGVVTAESSGEGGLSDVGAWTSAFAHARGSWQVGRRLSLEGQVGLIVPFVRYDFTAETGGTVTESAPVGFASALGLSFRL
jgi:hypothetical protein